PLVVKEGLAVGHQILEVPDLRTVDGGMVDLVQDAGGDGEPDRATGRVRRSYRVLRALGPSGRDPGRAEGARRGADDRHGSYRAPRSDAAAAASTSQVSAPSRGTIACAGSASGSTGFSSTRWSIAALSAPDTRNRTCAAAFSNGGVSVIRQPPTSAT